MDLHSQNGFLRLMKSAMSDAEHAYRCVFPEDNRQEDKCVALSYAATAIAKCAAAQAVYYSNPDLEHFELPDLFSLFDAFVHEIQEDYETDHSTQWVSIEFNKLKDAFDESVCSLPIVE